MGTEKISVLLSVYAKEEARFFDRALRSVFEQSRQPDEVVICTDGPLTLELEKVIEKYQELYPSNTKIVRFPHNRGLGKTLHDGLLECSNDIVFRMDTDDVSMHDRFEKQLHCLANTNSDVVGSEIIEYDEEMKQVAGKRSVPETDKEIKEYMQYRNPMNHMTVCFKKHKVLEVGSHTDMPGFEDYYLWARMMNGNCKFYNIQEPLVKVRGGVSMARRRGGINYIRNIVHFQNNLADIGIINTRKKIEGILFRSMVAIVPSTLRHMIYNGVLRRRLE